MEPVFTVYSSLRKGELWLALTDTELATRDYPGDVKRKENERERITRDRG